MIKNTFTSNLQLSSEQKRIYRRLRFAYQRARRAVFEIMRDDLLDESYDKKISDWTWEDYRNEAEETAILPLPIFKYLFLECYKNLQYLGKEEFLKEENLQLLIEENTGKLPFYYSKNEILENIVIGKNPDTLSFSGFNSIFCEYPPDFPNIDDLNGELIIIMYKKGREYYCDINCTYKDDIKESPEFIKKVIVAWTADMKISTMRTYRYALKRLFKKPYYSITLKEIEEMTEEVAIERGVFPAYKTQIKSFYRYLERQNILTDHPILKNCPDKSEVKMHKKPLTDSEEKKLRDYLIQTDEMSEIRTALLIIIVLKTGIGFDQVLKVRLKDLNLEKHLIKVQDETGERKIKLPNYFFELLNKYLKIMEVPESYTLCPIASKQLKNGKIKPIGRSCLVQGITRIKKTLGLKTLSEGTLIATYKKNRA